MAGRTLTISYVEGVIPGKWFRRWRDRMPDTPLEAFQLAQPEQFSALDDGTADMSFVRSPPESQDRHMIPLYTEAAVVVMPKNHELSVLDEIPDAELAGHPLLSPDLRAQDLLAPDSGWKALIQLVATGAGIVIAPQSIARLYTRKDVTHRPASDIEGTRIGLVWPKTTGIKSSENLADAAGSTNAVGSSDSPPATLSREDILQEFIGIVRGRTANSSRQPSSKHNKHGARRTGKPAGGKGDGSKSRDGANHGRTNPGKRRPDRNGTRPARRRRR